MSLQVRAAQLMAFVNPQRGRELFEWINLNVLPAACDGPLVPSVEEYYTALGLVARTTFGSNRAEGLWFLEFYLWRAHLPNTESGICRWFLQPDLQIASRVLELLEVVLGHEIQQVLNMLKFRAGKLRIGAWF